MPDDLICTCASRSYLENLPAFQPGGAFVGGLSPATRIEAGPIECQAVWLDPSDNRLRFEAITVLQIKTFGGGNAHNFTVPADPG